MKLEGVDSKQYQRVSEGFLKLSLLDRIIYSIATAAIALFGAYFLKALFTVLGLLGRVGLHIPSPLSSTAFDNYQRKLQEVQDCIGSQEFNEGTKLIALVQEIRDNTEELHRSCQEDPELMQVIYQSATDELQTLLEIAQVLIEGQSPEEFQQRLAQRINSQELCALLQQSNPNLGRIDELLQLVSVNKPMSGDPLHGIPLHYVAKKGCALESVPLLVAAGTDFNSQDDWGNTALHWAIANGVFSMADCLIQNAPYETDYNILGHGNTALHLALAKGYTNRTRDGAPLTVSSIDLMRRLIPHTNVNMPGRGGNTALHIACIRRDPVMISELLRAGADHVQINSSGETPFDMLKKSDAEAHQFLKSTACVYLLENRASYEECEKLFSE